MRALLCRGWDGYQALELAELPPPDLRPGCVRIAVHYATISYGQLLVVAGKYQRKPPLPFVPGTEVAGLVVEVAPDVTGFAPGDRVAASLDWGGFAEQAIATAATTWRVPHGIDLAAAATMPHTYGTSWAALHWRAGIERAKTIAVFGAAGGVGLTAIEVARLAGLEVIAVAGSEAKLLVAREHGAKHGLLHGEPELGRRIKALTGGRGVDIVYDPVGGALTAEALRCIAPEGRLVLIGFASGEAPRIPANLLLVKNVDVIGFWLGLYLGWGLTDERKRYEAPFRTMMDRLFAHTLDGAFRPRFAAALPLARFREAFDAVAEPLDRPHVVADRARLSLTPSCGAPRAAPARGGPGRDGACRASCHPGRSCPRRRPRRRLRRRAGRRRPPRRWA
jgi:NADPH2:quinone reductase